jgi:hypothetical protein
MDQGAEMIYPIHGKPFPADFIRKTKLIATLLVLLVMSPCFSMGEDINEDNQILFLALNRSYKDGGYTIVAPETRLSHLDTKDSKEIQQTKKYILDNIEIEGYDLSKLLDHFFERNAISVRLSIKSSLENGYQVDYDRMYEKYFEKNEGGWEQWYKEHPKAHGWTTVSLPAFDPESKIVLLYMGTQSHWLMGSGYIFVFKYDKGILKELKRVMLWIS